MIISNYLQKNSALIQLLLNNNSQLNEENIFSYSETELEKFLKDIMENNSSVSTVNIDDLIYKNGKFVGVDSEKDSDVKITDILNSFLKNDKVKNAVDTDNDGKLSTEEINAFLNAVESLDENSDEISINNIYSAMQSIEDGTFSDILEETNEKSSDVLDKTKLNDVYKGSHSGSVGNTYSGNVGDSSDIKASTTDKDNIQNMSLEQLQSKKTEQESVVADARDDVKSAYAGETESIKTAQADCDDKKAAYEEALENDENVTDELKEKQKNNQDEIDKQKTVIDGLKSDISDKENEITDLKTTISADESEISALQSAISSLSSQTSDDETVKADIASKLSAARSSLSSAQAKLAEDKKALEKAEGEKDDLEEQLTDEEGTLGDLEKDRESIEAEILKNCGEEVKLAMAAFKEAETNVETVKNEEISAAQSALNEAQAQLDEINNLINTKNAKAVEREYSVNSLGNPEQLYKSMGLEEQGLNYEVFLKAIEGYENIEDKGSGYLGIFDTTQSADAERYYLLDLNNFELVGRTVLKTGSGNMDNIVTANKQGSHATLSGFEKVGSEYYSNEMGKNALRLIGLEDGINDNAYAKGTVVHYTVYNSTWGCKGFTPVMKNGSVDVQATNEKMRNLFPENAIIFTYPTDERYWDMSEYYV